jgi:hypothetical protein
LPSDPFSFCLQLETAWPVTSVRFVWIRNGIPARKAQQLARVPVMTSATPRIRISGAVRLCLFAVPLLMTACTYTETGGAPGRLTIDDPFALPGQPALQAVGDANVPASAFPQSGTYAGLATATGDPGGLCSSPLRIDRFFVEGDRVVFGAFRGRIQADGALKMQVGPSYIFGRFQGNRFDGQFYRAGPTCPYRIALNRVSG